MSRRTLVALIGAGFALVGLLASACDETISATALVDGGATADGAAADGSPVGSDGSTSSDGAAKVDGTVVEAGGEAGVDFGTCAAARGTSACSPATGAGCNLAGNETCDYDPPAGNFACFPNGAVNGGVCDSCDPNSGKFCVPGFTCNPDSVCVRYCCANSDCKGHGNCMLPGPFDLPGIGICNDELTGFCASDAGTDAPVDAPKDG